MGQVDVEGEAGGDVQVRENGDPVDAARSPIVGRRDVDRAVVVEVARHDGDGDRAVAHRDGDRRLEGAVAVVDEHGHFVCRQAVVGHHDIGMPVAVDVAGGNRVDRRPGREGPCRERLPLIGTATGVKLPLPLPYSTETVLMLPDMVGLKPTLATAISRWPSPLKSAMAIEFGWMPAVYLVWVKVPLPLFINTLTVLSPVPWLATTRSM